MTKKTKISAKNTLFISLFWIACLLPGCGSETDANPGASDTATDSTQSNDTTNTTNATDATNTTTDTQSNDATTDAESDNGADTDSSNDTQDTSPEDTSPPQDTTDNDAQDTADNDTQDLVDPPECQSGDDCISGVCNAFSRTCEAANCADGVKNGDESDTDCGGNFCDGCSLGRVCFQDFDCAVGLLCEELGTICLASICGDGRTDGPESCDDGNRVAADGCSDTCAVELGWSCAGEPSTCIFESSTCGDGVVSGFEECDDGNQDGDDYCSNTCVAATCSDFERNGAESDRDCGGPDCPGCMTGYWCYLDADCASSICHSTYTFCVEPGPCGDGVINAGEQCDDPFSFNCDSDCTVAECGDGTLNPFGEECDDANGIDDDYCSNSCIAATCSDNMQNGDESDFDCGGVDCAGCTQGAGCRQDSDCQPGIVCNEIGGYCVSSICGDAVISGTETCDDANNQSGDGCDSSCQIE